jgi:hypothetical protein
MAIALAAFGFALAAFCVWLAVRIVNRRERWAKWTAVGLTVALLAYPLSAGPAVWLFVHVLPKSSLPTINALYAPMTYAIPRSQATNDVAIWYYGLWVNMDEVAEKLSGP